MVSHTELFSRPSKFVIDVTNMVCQYNATVATWSKWKGSSNYWLLKWKIDFVLSEIVQQGLLSHSLMLQSENRVYFII